MKYPHIPKHFDDDIFKHFTLNQEDKYLLKQCHNEEHILGLAILLKSYIFLGYPPKGVPVVNEQNQSIFLETYNIA